MSTNDDFDLTPIMDIEIPSPPPVATNEKPVRRRKQAAPTKRITAVQKEIRKQQTSVERIIPTKTFKNVVKSLIAKHGGEDKRLSHDALLTIQEAAEQFVVSAFKEADILRDMCKSKTLATSHLLNATRRVETK